MFSGRLYHFIHCLVIVPADQRKRDEAEFIVLKDGRIYFEGSAAELLASSDSYLATFMSGWVPPLVA